MPYFRDHRSLAHSQRAYPTLKMDLNSGTIIFYLEDKRYGYLRLQGTREEFHFRAKNLNYSGPQPGDLVTFRIKKTGQGFVAHDINRANLC